MDGFCYPERFYTLTLDLSLTVNTKDYSVSAEGDDWDPDGLPDLYAVVNGCATATAVDSFRLESHGCTLPVGMAPHQLFVQVYDADPDEPMDTLIAEVSGSADEGVAFVHQATDPKAPLVELQAVVNLY